MTAQLDFSFLCSPNPHPEWEEHLPWPGLLCGYMSLELTLKDRFKCVTTFGFRFCGRRYKCQDCTEYISLLVARYMIRRQT